MKKGDGSLMRNNDKAEYPVIFEDLYKIYKMGDEEVRALDGVTARFEKGSFWAI